jgi:signal transduction histidine kinase
LHTRSSAAAAPTRRLTGGVSFFLMAIGVAVLGGWALDLAVLKGLFGSITMKANAAVGLLASGLSLGLYGVRAPWAPAAGRAAATLAGAIGALTLSEHIAGWNLGIDELLFRETPGAAATTSPGRMGPNASLSLTLAGIALWQLYDGGSRAIVRAQIIGTCMAILALVPIVGYMYGAAQLYAIARYTGIALHTGVALLALSVGILAARPDVGPVAALTNGAPHGVMARRLLAQTIGLTLLLGYLRTIGEREGWYDAGFGTGIFVVAMIVLLSMMTWRTAVALSRSDYARQDAQAHRDALLVSERAARERAERADRAKDAFIASLSHELRTPLNAILGWMQMLQREAIPEAGRAKAIEAVTRNAGALTRLIEDLLDTSRIATGHLDLVRGPVPINEVVHAAVESVMPSADAKGVALVVAPVDWEPVVIGDAQRLQQVLWNLLSNAVKFTDRGGAVRVEITAETRAVVVRVRDEGVGIDPEFLPRVFEQFQTGSSAARSGGLGLGLHIARHLVDLHGGAIHVQSQGLGSGAVFSVQLPLAENTGAGPVPAPAAARSVSASARAFR